MTDASFQPRPFTLRVFFPDGNPAGMRMIDDNNWTGKAVCISRDDLENKPILEKVELTGQPGVYLLISDVDENAENTEASIQLYIGETDNISKRLLDHADKKYGKDNWHRAVVFISTKGALNKAHCLWLEHKLIARADELSLCILENGNKGRPATLTLSEEADCELFFEKILQILPLAGIQAFEKIDERPVRVPQKQAGDDQTAPNTVVVPARDGGFERVFLGEDCWYAIRIHKSRLGDLKYIAAYRVGNERKVTHIATIKEIVPYGDEGKYKLVFQHAAEKLPRPVPYITGVDSTLQAPRYTNFDKLQTARNLTELFDLSEDG